MAADQRAPAARWPALWCPRLALHTIRPPAAPGRPHLGRNRNWADAAPGREGAGRGDAPDRDCRAGRRGREHAGCLFGLVRGRPGAGWRGQPGVKRTGRGGRQQLRQRRQGLSRSPGPVLRAGPGDRSRLGTRAHPGQAGVHPGGPRLSVRLSRQVHGHGALPDRRDASFFAVQSSD